MSRDSTGCENQEAGEIPRGYFGDWSQQPQGELPGPKLHPNLLSGGEEMGANLTLHPVQCWSPRELRFLAERHTTGLHRRITETAPVKSPGWLHSSVSPPRTHLESPLPLVFYCLQFLQLFILSVCIFCTCIIPLKGFVVSGGIDTHLEKLSFCPKTDDLHTCAI